MAENTTASILTICSASSLVFWTSTRSTRDFDKACIMKIYLNFESAWWHHHLFEFDTANTFFSVRLIKD